MKIRGAVLVACGDTPAYNYLGGFKEGVGGAFRRCWCCLASADDISSHHFNSMEFFERTKENHLHYCNLIEQDDFNVAGFSTTYRINRRSILNELPFFDVTKCLPFDIMHTFFDGVAYLCLNELFKHSVDNLIPLDETNASIVQYSSVQSKPALIVRNGGPGSNFCLKQKASQMISLVKYLPLAIGDIYPSDDQHWNCFVLFWAVCYLSLLFEITQEDVGQMQWMVEAFLQSFSALYSGYINFTPKMHQMVHFHEQMTRFGPLRNTWCMRIEAKNKQIKGYVTNCFKNIPFTVGHQHQRSLSYHI
jgi:hypothetical protein